MVEQILNPKFPFRTATQQWVAMAASVPILPPVPGEDPPIPSAVRQSPAAPPLRERPPKVGRSNVLLRGHHLLPSREVAAELGAGATAAAGMPPPWSTAAATLRRPGGRQRAKAEASRPRCAGLPPRRAPWTPLTCPVTSLGRPRASTRRSTPCWQTCPRSKPYSKERGQIAWENLKVALQERRDCTSQPGNWPRDVLDFVIYYV